MNILQIFFALLAVLCFLIHFIYRFFWLTYANYHGTKDKNDKRREEGFEKSLDLTSWILLFLTVLFIILYKLVS